MSYHRGVFREQGGDKLVFQSTAAGAQNPGEAEFRTGTHIDMQSGSHAAYSAGAYYTVPIQTLGTSQTATNITNFGLTRVTGTTTGPTYTMAAPVVGVTKYLFLNATSSGATNRAVVRSNSTGVSFDTTGGNQVTMATSAIRGLSLVALTTAAWNIVGVYTGASVAIPRTT